MIIQFSIANYLSFKEPTTLSLAATSLRELEGPRGIVRGGRMPLPNQRALSFKPT